MEFEGSLDKMTRTGRRRDRRMAADTFGWDVEEERGDERRMVAVHVVVLDWIPGEDDAASN
jgi:hypothetical protein